MCPAVGFFPGLTATEQHRRIQAFCHLSASLVQCRNHNVSFGPSWGKMSERVIRGKAAPRLLTRWLPSVLSGNCLLTEAQHRTLSTEIAETGEVPSKRACLWRARALFLPAHGARSHVGAALSPPSKRSGAGAAWSARTHPFPLYLR